MWCGDRWWVTWSGGGISSPWWRWHRRDRPARKNKKPNNVQWCGGQGVKEPRPGHEFITSKVDDICQRVTKNRQNKRIFSIKPEISHFFIISYPLFVICTHSTVVSTHFSSSVPTLPSFLPTLSSFLSPIYLRNSTWKLETLEKGKNISAFCTWSL